MSMNTTRLFPSLTRCLSGIGAFFLILLVLSLSQAPAGEWRVSPIRLDLGSDVKSGVLSVVNEGTGKFQVQMKASQWSQDEEGKDQYTETSDIIFFPKFMLFDKPEERILRAGIKMPSAATEKTYRLFIEEIPDPKRAEGPSIAIAIRFGVPIFVKPLKEVAKGEISNITLSKGTVTIGVKNSGNIHFVINGVFVKGKNSKGEEVFSKKLDGWYLLNGVSRSYAAAIPREVCTDLTKLDIEVKTNRFNLDGKLDVDKTMCQ
jgi:fimbrial chaperone protein